MIFISVKIWSSLRHKKKYSVLPCTYICWKTLLLLFIFSGKIWCWTILSKSHLPLTSQSPPQVNTPWDDQRHLLHPQQHPLHHLGRSLTKQERRGRPGRLWMRSWRWDWGCSIPRFTAQSIWPPPPVFQYSSLLENRGGQSSATHFGMRKCF